MHHNQCTTTACTRSQGTNTCKQASSTTKWEPTTHFLPTRSLCRDLPPIIRARILICIAYTAYFLLKQVLYCVSRMLNMALCMLLPLLTISTWLSISMYAVSIDTTVFENRQSSTCMQSQNKPKHGHFHTGALHALAAVYSFLAQSHWVSACLRLLHAPKAIDKLTIKLTHVIEYAIQSNSTRQTDNKAYTCHSI